MKFHPNILLIISLLLVSSSTIYTQTIVKGIVLDSISKQPIPYVDFNFIGEDKYYTSQKDGSFYLQSDMPYTAIDLFAFGYLPKQIDIQAGVENELKIYLKRDGEEDIMFVDAGNDTISKPSHISTTIVDSALISTAKDSIIPDEKIRDIPTSSSVLTIKKKKKYQNKKENPAYRIMRNVWENKKENGLSKVEQYEYEQYEKIEFDLNNIDSSFMKSKVFKNFEFIFQKMDTSRYNGKAYLPIFLNESIYQVYGKNDPKKLRKDLIANRTSGFEDNEIVSQSSKELYKSFNIYDNRLNFFNKGFVSPVATDGFAFYEYELVDSIQRDGQKYYKIKYNPKNDSDFTFKGKILIADKSFAIKEISMHATKSIDVNFVKEFYIEELYSIVNDSIFLPESTYTLIDMSLLTKKDSARGIYAHKTVSYKNYLFDKVLPDNFYTARYDPVLNKAYEKDDVFWIANRHQKLTDNESGIYETLRKLKEVPRFNRMVKLVEILGSGYINIAKGIDIGNIYSTVGYNGIEGLRIRLGARTYFSRNDFFRLGAYIAYGFNDDKFKYGVEYRHMFNKYNRFILGIGTKRDVEQLGAQLTTDDGILSRSFASSSLLNRGSNTSLSNLNKTNVFASIDPIKNITLRLDGTFQTIKSADPSSFSIDYDLGNGKQSEIIDTHLTFTVIAAPGAKYSQYGIDRYKHSTTLSPTILLKYSQGLKGVFGSEFDYSKISLLYAHPLLIGNIGRSDIVLEAGKTFGKVPLSLLSTIPGNQSSGIVNNTFPLMNFYEFVTDTYVNFNITHHFNGKIFGKLPLLKKLKWRSLIFYRGAWGTISQDNININRSSITYVAPEDKIYYEYGFGIENIGIGNVRPFRIDFNWRGDYLTMPNANIFGITVGMNFSF